jgi:hypothetical protein
MGRYLTHSGSGYDLTSTEVTLLDSKGIDILLLADNGDATGGTGTTAANEASNDASGAMSQLKALKIYAPNTAVGIYRDIEPGQAITSAYITDWYTDITADEYTPGLYSDSESGYANGEDFYNPFCETSSTPFPRVD